MNRLKFKLNSDQLELLLAFESAKGLGHLAEVMARDPSVVSRNLQRIAEDYPVLKKVKGRWEITPLGIQINRQTSAFLKEQLELLLSTGEKKKVKSSVCGEDSILIVINAQNGLFNGTQEDRNNLEAETNIARALSAWRNKKRKVVHVKHVSEKPNSIFLRNTKGCDFLEGFKPKENEVVIEKVKSSAFAGTNLEEMLNGLACSDLVLVGFTANDCIDATARDAAALGFTAFVVGDATATFDLRDSTGRLVKADRIHKLTLLNINEFSAKVVSTNEILI